MSQPPQSFSLQVQLNVQRPPDVMVPTLEMSSKHFLDCLCPLCSSSKQNQINGLLDLASDPIHCFFPRLKQLVRLDSLTSRYNLPKKNPTGHKIYFTRKKKKTRDIRGFLNQPSARTLVQLDHADNHIWAKVQRWTVKLETFLLVIIHIIYHSLIMFIDPAVGNIIQTLFFINLFRMTIYQSIHVVELISFHI